MVQYFSNIKTTVYIFIFIAFLTSTFSPGNGLKPLRINVPKYRVPGESAQLYCDYDMGNDTLYSVKWYKDQEEFYRFVPKSTPNANSYDVDGVYVDMSKSNSKKVTLLAVDWRTSGVYKCEVSAEAPSFVSAQNEARMEIVSLPQEDPIISGAVEYEIGDRLDLNCTSGPSRPVSTLQWYVNEQQIRTETVIIHYPIVHHSKGLLSKTLGLSFLLGNRHFPGGYMKVKCVSTITSVLFRDDDDDDNNEDNHNDDDDDDSIEWRNVQDLSKIKNARHTLRLVKMISSSSGGGQQGSGICYHFFMYFMFHIVYLI